MKTKSILFIVAAVVLLSFTFVSKQTKETAQVKAKQSTGVNTSAKGGLAMEDQW
jgi:hypothetical protein